MGAGVHRAVTGAGRPSDRSGWAVSDGEAGTWGTFGAYLRSQRQLAQLSLRQLAALTQVSNPYLSQIERGLRRPSAEILQQIAKALRISAETLYVQAGILEKPDGDTDLARYIFADRHLTEEQRHALMRIYLSFRHENEDEAGSETVLETVRAANASAGATGESSEDGAAGPDPVG